MTDGAFLYILRCADGSYYTGTAALVSSNVSASTTQARTTDIRPAVVRSLWYFLSGSTASPMPSQPNDRSKGGRERRRRHLFVEISINFGCWRDGRPVDRARAVSPASWWGAPRSGASRTMAAGWTMAALALRDARCARSSGW